MRIVNQGIVKSILINVLYIWPSLVLTHLKTCYDEAIQAQDLKPSFYGVSTTKF